MNETTEEILQRISTSISEPTGGESEASFNFDILLAGLGTDRSSPSPAINRARQVTACHLASALDNLIEANTALPGTEDIPHTLRLAALKRTEHGLRSRIKKDNVWPIGGLSDLDEILQLRQATGQIAPLLFAPLPEPEPGELELDYGDLAEQSRLEFRPDADWSSAVASADLYEKLFSVQYDLSDEE